MRHRQFFIGVLLASTTTGDPAWASHAWQMPVENADAAGGAFRIDLPPEVYARVLYADLRDVEARNAAGEAIPFGPAPLRWAAPPPAPIRSRSLEPFALPPLGAASSPTEQLQLVVERDANGTLRRIDLGTSAPSASAADLLFDTGAVGPELLSLTLDLGDAGDAFRARVEVLASDDFDQWRSAGAAQSVLRLREGGRELLRSDIDLGGARARYLLLRRADGGHGIPTRGATLRSREAVPRVVDWPQSTRIDATLVSTGSPGEFFYRAPGPIPVDAVELQPADLNSVATVEVSSRDGESLPWQSRAAGTVFRIAVDGGEAGNLPQTIGTTRAREWRVTSDPPLNRAPRLLLSYTPDSWVMLAQGPAPYRLVAGSLDARRPEYPLATVLEQLERQQGPAFRMPRASVGAAQTLEPAALQAAPVPLPWRRIALWAVLIGGALAVVVLVLRLLRERTPEG